jgi:glycosyltransferase involved in cell wall biosynthesis
MRKISVIVCTYNRSEHLGGALRTLCHQTLDKSEYEVIVVDNNSADGTRELVEEFCRRFSHVRTPVIGDGGRRGESMWLI